MSIDSIVPVPPALARLEAEFNQLGPSMSSGLPSPSDPFAVLLQAATAPSSTTASTTNPSSTVSVEPQLVSLASSSCQSGALTDTAAPVVPASSSGSAIVSETSKFLGVPYVWGGASPSGFDCSGLVQYVFAELGVEMPHGSVAQSELGTPVASLADAQPGDLLFFEPGENGAPAGKPGHVGIYIGNGEMIDAPETGETVQVQAVPCPPLDIRRVAVPIGSQAAAASTSAVQTTDSAPAVTDTASGTPLGSAANGSDSLAGASVEIGTISVPSEYAGLIEQASAKSGTPAPLLAAILYNESRFEPDVVSLAGAEGIAQFMPTTAAANGVRPFEPASAIPGAASLLAKFHAAFGSWTDAIAAYAAGGGAVEAAHGVPEDGSTPAYVATTLAEAGMAQGS
ncbi:MAG: NlpC/P60 family protein [Acidimicrobiales bacterium]|jgi:cell wall-associated NlpC family hydrolase